MKNVLALFLVSCFLIISCGAPPEETKTEAETKGEAEKTIREAEGYSLDKINRAKGEAKRFIAVLREYQKAPTVTRSRLYLETLMEVLQKAKEKYIIDPKQSSILPLLNIGEKELGISQQKKKGGTK